MSVENIKLFILFLFKSVIARCDTKKRVEIKQEEQMCILHAIVVETQKAAWYLHKLFIWYYVLKCYGMLI